MLISGLSFARVRSIKGRVFSIKSNIPSLNMTKFTIVSLYQFLRYNCKWTYNKSERLRALLFSLFPFLSSFEKKTPSGKGGEETRGGRDDVTVKITPLLKEETNPLHHSTHNIASLTRKFKYYFFKNRRNTIMIRL